MAVHTIRSAICDRCGAECSCIHEKILNETALEHYDIKTKIITENIYHYTEISLRGFDSRFSDTTEAKIILCGDCISSLSDWLKKESKNI